MPPKTKKSKTTIKDRTIIDPETLSEAMTMVQKGWFWLLKKQPAIALPLTLWMLFGGGIFLYNYLSADKFEVKEAKPIGESLQIQQNTPITLNFSPMPQAVAAQTRGKEIRWNNKLYGYEDVDYIAKVAEGQSKILVYHWPTKKVYQIDFDTDYKMQMMKR